MVCYQKGQEHTNDDFFSHQAVDAYLDQKAELEGGGGAEREYEPLEGDSPHEAGIPHLAQAQEKVVQEVGMEQGPIGSSKTQLDYAKLLRQLFEWLGGVPFSGGELGNINEASGRRRSVF